MLFRSPVMDMGREPPLCLVSSSAAGGANPWLGFSLVLGGFWAGERNLGKEEAGVSLVSCHCPLHRWGSPKGPLEGLGGVGGAEVQVRWRYRSSRLPCPEPCLLSGPWVLPLISSLLGYPPPQNPSSLCLAWRPFRENIDSHGGSIRAEGTPPRGSAFKQTPGLKECLPLRPCGLEPRQRAEVAPVDGTCGSRGGYGANAREIGLISI